ncbi:MAG: DUF4157 domain-containing protein [Bacteroidetes bacterium]|nr:DUF4157 domain-containing protein [Bacteroidota bacterium]
MPTYIIKENSFIARLAARKLKATQLAIVIGRTIHLHNTDKQSFLANSTWLRHELKHIEQFRRYGFFRFIILYLWESLLHGYRDNRFEHEAREAEREVTSHTLASRE